MKLEKEELATLDLTEAHEKALEAHEQLERLAKIAADPDAYTLPEFQAAMDTAKYIESYWGSGPIALEAEDVVAAFVSQVEARRACRKYNLVPRAELDEAKGRLKQADEGMLRMTQDMAARLAEPKSATRTIVLSGAEIQAAVFPGVYCPSESDDFPAIVDRINALIAERMASIGPGNPEPPPPPPTNVLEPWTVDRLKRVFDQRDILFDMDDDAAELVVELIKNNGGAANKRVGIKAP